MDGGDGTGGVVVRAAVGRRTRSVLGGGGAGRRSPVIVKCISTPKGRAAVGRVVAYVARLDDRAEGDRAVAVRDEAGREVAREEVRSVLAEWGLMADSEHLSPAARRLAAAGGDIQQMPMRERLRHVQARHYVFSARCGGTGEDGGDTARLEAAVGATVWQTFGSWGHRCLWAVHREHGRHPHVHVVVRAVSDDGRRLRSPRHGLLLDGLRDVLVQECRRVGLDVDDATRVSDRREVLEELAAGRWTRRDRPEGRWRRVCRDAGEPVGWQRVRRQAPGWWVEHGGAYLQRASDRALRRALGVPEEEVLLGEAERQRPDRLRDRLWRRAGLDRSEELVWTPALQALAEEVSDVFGAALAREAVERFERLRRADADLALRMLLYRPGRLLGVIGEAPGRDRDRRRRVRALVGALPRQEKDRAAVAGGLEQLGRRLRLLRIFMDDAGGDATGPALERFERLRAELAADGRSDALARWWLVHQPILFGPVSGSGAAAELARDREIGRLVRTLPRPPAERRRLAGGEGGRQEAAGGAARRLEEVLPAAERAAARRRVVQALLVLAWAVERLQVGDRGQAAGLRALAERVRGGSARDQGAAVGRDGLPSAQQQRPAGRPGPGGIER